jgi:hypothetical protein
VTRPPGSGRQGGRPLSVRIQAPLGGDDGHDEATPTAIDPAAPDPAPSRRSRRRTPTPPPTADRAPAEDARPTEPSPGIPAPRTVASGRLSELRVKETLVRRQAPSSPVPEVPIAAEPSAPGTGGSSGIRIAWARSEDSSQKLSPHKKHGVVIAGIASGTRAGRNRPGAPAPSLSIGIDGAIYAVPAAPGQLPLEAAQRLALVLERRFSVAVEALGDGRALLRLLFER